MLKKQFQDKSGDNQSDFCHQDQTLVGAKTSNCDHEDCIRLVFDDANVGMCMVDLEGRLLSVNRHMCNMFG